MPVYALYFNPEREGRRERDERDLSGAGSPARDRCVPPPQSERSRLHNPLSLSLSFSLQHRSNHLSLRTTADCTAPPPLSLFSTVREGKDRPELFFKFLRS
eukprot:Tamp_16005.p6 GENE.Tamp_16005~~Tamp_16005.p6  ORF type:complete len:101 (-),score=6.90 Tamp_16005:123-425(-)